MANDLEPSVTRALTIHSLFDRLLAQGFRPGLRPERPVTSAMHEALPRLLDAFGSR